MNEHSNHDELIHFGIKGQKWGVRRFQNEDRTLTEAGKKRYRAIKDSAQKQKEQIGEAISGIAKKMSGSRSESSKWKPNEAKRLSDDELNRRINRLNKEKQYRELTQTRGQKFMKSTRKTLGKIFVYSLIGVATGVVTKKYKDFFEQGAASIAKNAANVIK